MSEQVRPNEASSARSQIARRQEQVIDAVLIPAWYWSSVAAACVAIGAAVDSNNAIVRAVIFPIAIGAVVVLTTRMIFGGSRRARVRSSELLRGPGALAIVGTVWLVAGVTIGTGFGLRAAGAPVPATLATLVGSAALLAAGAGLRRILRRIMLCNLTSVGR